MNTSPREPASVAVEFDNSYIQSSPKGSEDKRSCSFSAVMDLSSQNHSYLGTSEIIHPSIAPYKKPSNWEGKHWTFCRGRIMTGPHPLRFILTFTGLSIPTIYFLASPIPVRSLIRPYCEFQYLVSKVSVHYLLISLLIIIPLYVFLISISIGDPGFVPRIP
jgi:hypothetical protein